MSENLTRREVVKSGAAAALLLGSLGSPVRAQQVDEDINSQPHRGPRRVKSIETAWVRMRDGVKIALRIILPEDADTRPVPAIIDYAPYRRRDLSRRAPGDHFFHYASHGYACVQPDIRGSGDSQGVLLDEYLQSEQDDGVEIIAWLARQPWCTGKVGMEGCSWAGFSALQVAARRPPELKAIITDCAADDRYTDDAHYLGGAITQDMFLWGSMFYALQAYPPDPAVVGSRWRDMWRQRCESLDFSVARWVRHQTRDAFWKHGSVDENYAAIQCAVYAIGGWTDGYCNAPPRLIEHLTAPRKALIGPWEHNFPHDAAIGPAMDYPTEALRWWDYWLKGIDTGIMQEPMYRAWMPTDTAHIGVTELPGRWVAEEKWPSPRIQMNTWHLNRGTLDASAAATTELVLAPHQTVGKASGHWCPGGGGPVANEMPLDQREDDAYSLVFDGAPLDAKIEILGLPLVELDIAVDQPVALLAVRLNAVRPNGASRRVSYAVLNLTHREGHEHPQPLEPGKRYRIKMRLKNAAFSFQPGDKLRVSVSAAYWYLVWPSPRPVTLTLFTGGSTLLLPVRPPQPADEKLQPFAAVPRAPEASPSTRDEYQAPKKKFEWDVGTSTLTITSEGSATTHIEATGTTLASRWKEVSRIADDDPTSAFLESSRSQEFKRGDWHARIDSSFQVSVDQQHYLLKGTITTYDQDKLFFTRSWDQRIPRILS